MYNTYTKFILFFSLSLFMCTSYPVQAQDQLSSQNRKALRYYQKGNTAMGNRDFVQAISYAERAIRIDGRFTEAYIMIAESYSFTRDCEKSCVYFEKAIASNPDFSYKLYYFAANEFMRCGNFEKAVSNFEEYFRRFPSNISEIPIVVRENYELCLYRLQLMDDSLPINPINMGPRVNSAYAEYLPSLTVDESKIVFTVRRKADDLTVCLNCLTEEDMYYSEQVDGIWQDRKPFELNTHYNEGGQSISSDGKYLIFTACERDEGYASCDLYWSKRIGDAWSKPRNFGKPVNTQYWESQPTFSADGKNIIFVSNRPGGLGGMDLWSTQMIEEGVFSTPVNLGIPVNTMKNEDYPFLHPNGKTLYFSSEGHKGMGGKDIFYSELLPDNTWSEPVNLGYPINTYADEMSLVVNAKGDKAFYSSDRAGGYGKDDLYWFNLPETLRPQSVTYMKGRIFDAKDNTPLEAFFHVVDLKTGNVVVSSSSDVKTGEFLICIPTSSSYALHAQRRNYLFYSENFELKDVYTDIEPYVKDIFLKRIELGESVVLNNIFFDTDKSDLKPESEIELKNILQLLMDNPRMRIEISGHTDNIGSKEHNLALSQARAKAVFDYLVNKGIKANRMDYKGYGFSVPIASNESDEGRTQNRRTEFKIIGF
ncbi:MAG: OmpA family protein [Bacteroidales bacterium]|nr:OmpA family protein [Bacteroidales bacterium]